MQKADQQASRIVLPTPLPLRAPTATTANVLPNAPQDFLLRRILRIVGSQYRLGGDRKPTFFCFNFVHTLIYLQLTAADSKVSSSGLLPVGYRE
jgi:hypothetical protein